MDAVGVGAYYYYKQGLYCLLQTLDACLASPSIHPSIHLAHGSKTSASTAHSISDTTQHKHERKRKQNTAAMLYIQNIR